MNRHWLTTVSATLLACVARAQPGDGETGGSGPVGSARAGIWVDPAEIRELPMTGRAWKALKHDADEPLPAPDLSNKEDNSDVAVLARALVYVRTGEARYKEDVVRELVLAMGTESDGDVLALARNLPGYVIAAQLVELPPAVEPVFRTWITELRDRELDGSTLRRIHETRPNNWGTHAGASRAVIARYLDDPAELERVAQVFHGWLGDRETYSGFKYGALDWQSDPAAPVGINPKGAQRDGHSIDGVLPDDQRRAGGFEWPPPHENYVYEALQGALLQAMVLSHAGYEDVWEWEDRALLRAFLWLQRVADFPAQGDDTWQAHVINSVYGAVLPAPIPSRPGKSVGFTDWTLSHAQVR
jgi:hypothetical protein